MVRFFVLACLLIAFAPYDACASLNQAPTSLCQDAVAMAERHAHLPYRLLEAISKIESGRRDPIAGLQAWPWTINAQGQGYFYRNKAEAIAAAQDFRAHGIESIDVGCMQVNLHHHPDAFASLDDAFDPDRNAQYGAHFISELFGRLHSWSAATGAYHSLTPQLGEEYAQRVMALWNEHENAPSSVKTSFSPPTPPRPRPFPQIASLPPPRIIRQAAMPSAMRGSSGQVGRDLLSYRRMPVRLALQR